MSEELTKAKELARARRQIRLQMKEATLSGLVEGIQRFAWTDSTNGENYVGPEFDPKLLEEAIEEAVDEVHEARKKLLGDPEKGPDAAEAARVLLSAIGCYGMEIWTAIAALEMVKAELMAGAREAAKMSALHETMRAAFLAEAPDTEH